MKTKLIATGMLLGSACLITNAFAQESKLPLANTEWTLTAVDGKMATGASLNFKDKELFGKFCNHFSTSYQEKNGTLKTEVLAMTRMLCQGDIMQHEMDFDPEGAKLELSEKGLKLTQTNGHTYEWEKAEAEKKSHFDNGEWKLLTFNDKAAVSGATLSFSGDWLSAKFCNRMSGKYEPRAGKIKAEGLMTTLMMCQGELGEYEMAFEVENASYEMTKEGKLLITTTRGDRFLWEQESPLIGMPNPAAVYCLEKGGKGEIKKDKDGNEYGVCNLPNNVVCDEWAFFRGECPSQEKKIHHLLDDHFQKNAKAFPTAKEKTALLAQVKKVFVAMIEKADQAMKESYQNVLKLIENYKIRK